MPCCRLRRMDSRISDMTATTSTGWKSCSCMRGFYSGGGRRGESGAGLNCAPMKPPGALLLLLAGPALAHAQPPAGFTRARLENGLTVLVQEDHRAPLVSVGMMYAV